MIKDIVVNLGLGTRDPAGDYAITMAEAFEAHLLGIAVSGQREIVERRVADRA